MRLEGRSRGCVHSSEKLILIAAYHARGDRGAWKCTVDYICPPLTARAGAEVSMFEDARARQT